MEGWPAAKRSSDDSVNNEMPRRNAERSSAMGEDGIDFDPCGGSSSDVSDQCRHCPLEYNTFIEEKETIIPSPARESSKAEGYTEDELYAAEYGMPKELIDPAMYEWLLHFDNGTKKHLQGETEAATGKFKTLASVPKPLSNTTRLAGFQGKEGDFNDEATENGTCEEQGWSKESTGMTDDGPKPTEEEGQRSMQTPITKTATRRSARINNRSGPIETTERYAVAAKVRSLELQPEVRNSKIRVDDLEGDTDQQEVLWELVAKGSGYVISPTKKEMACSFIKGASG